MNRYLTLISALALTACAHNHSADEHHEADEHAHEHAADVVSLSDEMAQRFGVETDIVQPRPMLTAIEASGVIDRSSGSQATLSSPAAGIVRYASGISSGSNVGCGALIATVTPGLVSGGDSNASALAALKAAEAEEARLRPLYEQKLVTAATYQAAVAALEQARAAYSPAASGGRALAPIAGVVELQAADGAFVDAGAPLAAVYADGRLTLNARVNAGDYGKLAAVTDARIATADGRKILLSELNGRKTGVSSAAGGYATVTFEFGNDGSLAPGLSVDVWLLAESAAPVIAVPVDALTERQGAFFVYKLIGPEHYQRVQVTPGASDGAGVAINSGLNEGDVVVSRGVGAVRLADTAGAAPQGHTHNH